ncbi:MAG TPA: helix-turn-helix domain-containing protein [Acidimicrobiales bacterium]
MSVLSFFAARPSESFGLSELSRALNVDKATLLTIVRTLVDGGWLLQHPDRRRYSLGPTLIGTGLAALSRFPDPTPLRRHMEQAAIEFGTGCTAVAAAEGQLVILARVGYGGMLPGLTREGVRLPFCPPYGLALAAWLTDAAFDEWINAAKPPLTQEERRSVQRALQRTREAGYAVGLELPAEHPLSANLDNERHSTAAVHTELLEQLATARRHLQYHLTDIDDRSIYRVGNISAPVRTATSAPQIALFTPYYGAELTGAEVRSAGERLAQISREAAESVEAAGRSVAPSPADRA